VDDRRALARLNARAPNAPFALVCAIDRLGAATIPLVAPSENTAVARVEAVVRAPEELGDLTGAEITVHLGSRADAGQRLLLFAEAAMYGASIAVREVGRADPDAADEARERLMREEEGRPVRNLRERARGADVVVRGVVGELRPVVKRGEWVPTSEHDPDWWIAVIVVRDIAKGRRPRGGRVEAVFANSRDVQWIQAPKPAPGQEAVFLLRRERRFTAPKGALVLLDPDDVQPPDHYDDIRRLVQGAD